MHITNISFIIHKLIIYIICLCGKPILCLATHMFAINSNIFWHQTNTSSWIEQLQCTVRWVRNLNFYVLLSSLNLLWFYVFIYWYWISKTWMIGLNNKKTICSTAKINYLFCNGILVLVLTSKIMSIINFVNVYNYVHIMWYDMQVQLELLNLHTA